MKRTLSIFSSLLLLGWTQFVAVGATTPAAAKRTTCCGCDCTKKDCCVAQSAPASPSQTPAVPARSTGEKQLSFPVAGSVLWVLPAAEACSISLIPSLPHLAAGAPLYERNCALLI